MRCLLTVVLLHTACCLYAQSYQSDSIISLSEKQVRGIESKLSNLDESLNKRSRKYLRTLSSREEKLYRQLARIDSSRAAEVFGNINESYEFLSQKIGNATGKFEKLSSGEYLAGLDSLQGSLAFLKDAAHILSRSKDIRAKLGTTLNQANQLQHRLQEAGDIQNYIQQRQAQISELLSGLTNVPGGLTKYFGRYQQEVYYYSRQISEYKEALNNPDKLIRKILSTLQSIPAFSKFFSKYSMLASLFPTPENYGTAQALAGLQTRADVMQIIQQQLPVSGTDGTNGNPAQYLQQQIQQAQGELTRLRDKLNELGITSGGNSDMVLPDFTPNNQKTKSFLKRIEYGVNFQSQRASDFFPTTTELGLMLGYKLNDKSRVGMGVTGKMGWGKGWSHIKITGEGVGLRTYAEWKAPDLFKTGSRFMASLWFTAGVELNYSKPVESLTVFKNYDNWTKSALAGLSKKVGMNSPFKKGKKMEGNVQVLYDFLHNRHVPPTPALVWRVGYNF